MYIERERVTEYIIILDHISVSKTYNDVMIIVMRMIMVVTIIRGVYSRFPNISE